MTEQKFESAAALFAHALTEWGSEETFILRGEDALPDEAYTWWQLHPREVEIFGIEPALYPRLVEAYSWYVGAIAGSDHNEYHEFRDAERARWSQYVVTKDGETVFDRAACVRFMHQAGTLPLRQCEALLQKFAAAELRGSLVQFSDEALTYDEERTS